MAEKVKVGYSIDEETSKRIKCIAEITHRADSHVIDWLVAEAWQRMQEASRATTPISEAEAAHAPQS